MNSTTISDHNHTFPESLVLLSKLNTYPHLHSAPGLSARLAAAPRHHHHQHSPAQPHCRCFLDSPPHQVSGSWTAETSKSTASPTDAQYRELTFHKFSYRTRGPEMTVQSPRSHHPDHCIPGARSPTSCTQVPVRYPEPPGTGGAPPPNPEALQPDTCHPWGWGTACSWRFSHTQTP